MVKNISVEMVYTFHKYEDTKRKYSEFIANHLRQQHDCKEDNSDNIVDWSDKNRKSRIKDYYSFPNKSIVDKKYLPELLGNRVLLPKTYTGGNFDKFVKQCKRKVFFLKPADKYIGGSKDIAISNDPYKLFKSFIKNQYVIQEEIEPMLINGYKFDIRVYVLLVFNKIMHVYLDYGIVRFCKEKYVINSTDLDSQITIHGNFEYTNNIDLQDFYPQIKDIIYETLVNYKPPKHIGYQYLGYDIMISKNKDLYLLEVNIQPSLERINYNTYLVNNFSNLILRSVLSTVYGFTPFMSYSDNIILTDLSMTFLNDLYNITSNIEVMQYIGNLKIWSYQKTKKFIEYGNSEHYYYKGIIHNYKLVGIIGIYYRENNWYLVIYLNPQVHGLNIALRSYLLFINTIHDKQIYADVLDYNIRSIEFFKKSQLKWDKINNIYRFYIKV